MMVILIEIVFLRLSREIARLWDFIIISNGQVAFLAGNRMEVIILERPGLGDDGRFFPPPM